MIKANFSIPIEAGLLIRKDIRRFLYDYKFKIENKFPDASIKIYEEKGWLDSYFNVVGKNIPKLYYNKFKIQLSEFIDED
jgi:hypothetical protein